MSISDSLRAKIVDLRRDLHMHPELSFEEERTSRKVVEAISGVPGVEIQTGIAKTGVVALLRGDQPGPCIALRADMDALPIQEEAGVDRPWQSKVPGKMHACGHDGHTAALVGAVHALAERRAELKGSVKFIFQPAEEHIGGARVMVDEGVLDSPAVSAIFAAHIWPRDPYGSICLTKGPAMASVDDFDIVVHGRGGHAAAPHLTIDPVLVAAQIVVAAQGLVARGINPFDQAVVSICQINGGSANNVIPERVELGGTIRTYLPELRQELVRKFVELVNGIAESFGARAEVTTRQGYPSVINDGGAFDVVARVAGKTVKTGDVNLNAQPSMGAEDFSYYLQRVPGMFWKLGSQRLADEPQLHTPQFDFCDGLLPLAVQMHVGVALEALRYYGEIQTIADNQAVCSGI
jgi:amidohydrolase